MHLDINLVDIIIICLAVYRLSKMLANQHELGPFGMLHKLRLLAGAKKQDGFLMGDPGSLAEGMLCEKCNSVWLGFAVVGLYAGLQAAGLPASLLLAPLAASGLVVLLADFP